MVQQVWRTVRVVHAEANRCGRGRGRRSASNIVPPGGPTRTAQNKAKSPAENWSLMIPDDIVMRIVGYTNTKITQLHEITGGRLAETDKKTQYGLTSLAEMKAWFGLLYLRAALKLNTTDTDVWYHESSNDIFSATMQRKRFTFPEAEKAFATCCNR